MKITKSRAALTFFAQETLPKAEAEGHDQQGCHRSDWDQDGESRPNYERVRQTDTKMNNLLQCVDPDLAVVKWHYGQIFFWYLCLCAVRPCACLDTASLGGPSLIAFEMYKSVTVWLI